MIFVWAAALGLALAVVRVAAGRDSAATGGRASAGIGLRWWPLAVACLAAQFCLTSGLGMQLAGPWRLAALWTTNAALAAVLLANLSRPGMRWLLVGMTLNFAVMAANGGLMPVSPETLVRGGHGGLLARTAVGQPLPSSKDVVLPDDQTRLALLADRLVIPGKRGSFSLGDALIAAGIVLALGSAGGRVRMTQAKQAGGPVRGRRSVWSEALVT